MDSSKDNNRISTKFMSFNIMIQNIWFKQFDCNLKYHHFSDGNERKGGFMSRCRMVYCLGGESLNDVKKSERYKAPEIQLFDPTGENDDYVAPAPGPAPARPQPPKSLRTNNGKRRRLNPPEDEPGPSGIPVPAPQPSRASGRTRKKPSRLVEEWFTLSDLIDLKPVYQWIVPYLPV